MEPCQCLLEGVVNVLVADGPGVLRKRLYLLPVNAGVAVSQENSAERRRALLYSRDGQGVLERASGRVEGDPLPSFHMGGMEVAADW